MNEEQRIIRTLYHAAKEHGRYGKIFARPHLGQWFAESIVAYEETPSPSDDSWDMVVLYTLFSCWMRLFRRKDMEAIPSTIDRLRREQKTNEPACLSRGSVSQNRIMALRLIGFYHWAKATEIVAECMIREQFIDDTEDLDKHFEASIRAMNAARQGQFENILKLLHREGKKMVSGKYF